jgi:hypothetical protein
MKKNLFLITEEEKNRILGMHMKATKSQYLSEAGPFEDDQIPGTNTPAGTTQPPAPAAAATAATPAAAPTAAAPTAPTAAAPTAAAPESQIMSSNDRDYAYKKEGDKYYFKLQPSPASPSAQNFQKQGKFVDWTEATGKGLEAHFEELFVQIGSAKYTNSHLVSPEGFISSESRLFVSINHLSIGFLEFPWENRPGIEALLHRLRHTYEIHLISGDKKEHASHLVDWFDNQDHLKFECSPMQKMEYIQELQQQGKIVAMIGDGLNDAGALKQANVGIAVSDDHLHFTPSSEPTSDSNKGRL